VNEDPTEAFAQRRPSKYRSGVLWVVTVYLIEYLSDGCRLTVCFQQHTGRAGQSIRNE
jgi:hypothetical protein